MALLQDRVAIVTGASSGIGRAIACRFAEEGARVVIADQREVPIEGGELTLDLITAAGGQAVFQPTDVSRRDDHERLVAATVERFGRLDIMVNNAATFSGTALLDTSDEQWDRVMAVNLTGVFLGCQVAIRQMVTQAPYGEVRGRVINIASQHGMIAPRTTAPTASPRRATPTSPARSRWTTRPT